MNSEPERHIRFQFWLSEHDGSRGLYNEWSDGEIEAADVMLPDRIVDLQHWDAGIVWNHLVDSGWQPGTIPYGIDLDEPVPEILPDHETRSPASLLLQRHPSTQPRLHKRPMRHLNRPKGP